MRPLRLWPDENEQLLLDAALADTQQALDAFAAWRKRVDLGGPIDGASFRLLPLVHSNLKRHGWDDPIMGRLLGVYRHSWCEAQTHLRQGAEIISLLRSAEIDVMISKGMALAIDFYPSPALRPMSDIDVYVPRERAFDALAVLRDSGWIWPSEAERKWSKRTADMLELISGVNLHHPLHGELDLHWRLHQDCASPVADERFWTGAVTCRIGDVDVLRLRASDLLFHVIIHGLRPNEMPPIRWVADAAMVLRREGADIDWDDLLSFASRMRLRHRLGRGLAFLRERMRLPIPAEAIVTRRYFVEVVEDRAFRSLLAEGSHTGREGWLHFLAFIARFAAGGGRRHLPRLALGWTMRRLRPRNS